MDVRLASKADVKEIRNLTLSLSIERNSNSGVGFLEYPLPSEWEYATRISGSKFFFVARERNELAGFVAAFSNDFLKDLKLPDNEIDEHIANDLEKGKGFVYVDQLAVAKEFQGRGVGKLLMQKVFEAARKDGFVRAYSAIVCQPLRNPASEKLHLSAGFRLVEEFAAYGKVFGIYCKGI